MEKKKDFKNIIIVILVIMIVMETILGFLFLRFRDNVKEDSVDVFYHAETREEIDELRTLGKAVIVVFGADYCPMCINYKPYVKEIANLYGEDVIVKYIDTVEHEAIRKEYNIELVPSTLFFDKNGQVYEPSFDLDVIKSDEIVEERRYISDEFRVAEEGEVPLHDQFEYGLDENNELAYCKFVGILDVIQFEEIILELNK